MTAPEQFLQPVPYGPLEQENLMKEVFAPSNYAAFLQSLRLDREQSEMSASSYLPPGVGLGDEMSLKAPEGRTQKYTVKEGDSLWSIVTGILNKNGEEPAAWKTLDTLRKIAEKNHLNNPDLIHPGDVIDFSSIEDVDTAQQNSSGNEQVVQTPNKDNPENTDGGSSASGNTTDGAGIVALNSTEQNQTEIKPNGSPNASTGTLERDRWYISQAGDGSNWYACGPTSLTMALAAYGISPATESNRQKLIRETGTNPDIGFPGTSDKMAAEARRRGLNAESRATTDWREVDAQLSQGRSVIVNGTMAGRNGALIKHFVFIAGKDPAGNYIVGDPAKPNATWTSADLRGFLTRGGEPNGYAAVWR